MFTTIASYPDPIQAQIVRGLLASEGIEAHVGDEHLALANWEWRLAIGGNRVRVAAEDAERALRILRALEAGEYAIDDDAAPADPQRRVIEGRCAFQTLIPSPRSRRYCFG